VRKREIKIEAINDSEGIFNKSLLWFGFALWGQSDPNKQHNT
jgi:hypothetical protein